MFLLWTAPLAHAPKPIRLMAIFASSMIAHFMMFYAIHHRILYIPIGLTFLGQGLGCVLERYVLKRYGIRTGGPWGLVWAVGWSLVWGIPLVNAQYGSGWMGYVRRDITLKPEMSVVEWAVYALGWPSVLRRGAKGSV
jgi:hypothetical protein